MSLHYVVAEKSGGWLRLLIVEKKGWTDLSLNGNVVPEKRGGHHASELQYDVQL